MARYDLEDRLLEFGTAACRLAVSAKSVDPLLRECDELLAILATSIRTARARSRANDQ